MTPRLMEQGIARTVAKRCGERSPSSIYVAAVYPLGAWGGEEQGWAVYRYMAVGGYVPVDLWHVAYPHEPGYLHDCPACEAYCHCTEGSAECTWVGHEGAS